MKLLAVTAPALLLLSFAATPSAAEAQVGSALKDGAPSCAYRAGSRKLVELRGHTDDKKAWTFTIDGARRDARALGYTQGNDKSWKKGDRITIDGVSFVKHSLPQVRSLLEIEFFAEHDGVYVGIDPYMPKGEKLEMVYVLMRSVNCEFQPYKKAG